MTADPRRAIPSVESIVAGPAFERLRAAQPRDRLTGVVREVVDELRADLEADPAGAATPSRTGEWFATEVAHRLNSARHAGPRRVINATGVVLHTNLGRAPLAAAALKAIEELGGGYLDLEYDLTTGERGSRYDHCTGLLRELTGADAALVVNNNAAAVVLAVNTLARGRDVVVSRGELIEIGGSFRIADIVERSGARLLEVGATNKTRIDDYARVLTNRTGAILKVHRSNFSVSGFVEEVDARALAGLGRARGVPVIHDLGSGLLLDDPRLPAAGEPTVRAALADGADVVTMSGDKLLGGPQAGIVLGVEAYVGAMRGNPLCRALRPDRTTIAALQATLALYGEAGAAIDAIPALRMLAADPASISIRADRIATALRKRGIEAETAPGESAVGGGALPEARLATTLVLLDGRGRSADDIAGALRRATPPVVARIVDDRVALDPRTVAEDEEAALVEAVGGALQ